jgi:hypothetical protein
MINLIILQVILFLGSSLFIIFATGLITEKKDWILASVISWLAIYFSFVFPFQENPSYYQSLLLHGGWLIYVFYLTLLWYVFLILVGVTMIRNKL